jgi:DNA-binding GntR family transcriptional regulator
VTDVVPSIHERVRDAILSGDLPAGEELSQARLASAFNVSRTPLREPLHMLIDEGLLVGQQNRQLRVADVSLADMESLYVERLALEAVAIRITIPKLTGEQIDVMRERLQEMHALGERRDLRAFEVPHRALHESFICHAGPRLLRHLTRLAQHAERYRRLYPTAAWKVGLAEHEPIIEACAVRDEDAAAHALVLHLGHMALTVMHTIDPRYRATSLRRAIAAAAAPALPALDLGPIV